MKFRRGVTKIRVLPPEGMRWDYPNFRLIVDQPIIKKETKMKRIVIEYTPRGSDKVRYAAAKLDGYGGDTIILETRYGRMTFSRVDGRWLEGDCLNYLDGHIFEVNDLDDSIRRGNVFAEYEGTSEKFVCTESSL